MHIPRLAALLAVLLTGTAHAQIYQWHDAQGRPHFGDQPPANSHATPLRRGAPPPPAAAATPDSASEEEKAVLPEYELRRRAAAEKRALAAEAKKEETERQAAEEERQRNCQLTRNQLTALESGQRIARFSESGEREFLDDAQRAQETERVRNLLQQHCTD